MSTYTVLIADDNQVWCRSLKTCLECSPALNILPPVQRGNDAMDCIAQSRPDIIIMDLVLPVYDGLYIINYIGRELQRYDPVIYVLSALGTEKTNKIMRGLNADYYSIKPIAESAVLDNLLNLVHLRDSQAAMLENPPRPTTADLDRLVDDYLYELGAPLYRVSTRSLRLALRMALEDESVLKSSMELYHRVSVHESVRSQSVHAIERNLRTTIKTIQDTGNSFYHKCFPDQKRRMTNTEFLNKSVYILKTRMERMIKYNTAGGGIVV